MTSTELSSSESQSPKVVQWMIPFTQHFKNDKILEMGEKIDVRVVGTWGWGGVGQEGGVCGLKEASLWCWNIQYFDSR